MLLVLGTFALPRSREVVDLVESVQSDDALWLMAAAAFFLASVGLTLGLPAIYSLLPPRLSSIGMVGLWVWSFGMIGTAGLSALLVLFRAVARELEPTVEQIEVLAADPGLTISALGFVGAFYFGELVVALVLLRGRTVGRWVPLLMLGHLAMEPAMRWLPDITRSLHAVMIGLALMGLAVKASEKWTDVRGNLHH